MDLHTLERIQQLEKERDELQRKYDDLRRAWPQDVHHVDATPDNGYPHRILESYIDDSILEGTGDLPKIMNEAQAERNEILRKAIATLTSSSS